MDITPREFALRMELAKQEAVRLRQAAIAAFWADAARAARAALARGRGRAPSAGRRVAA